MQKGGFCGLEPSKTKSKKSRSKRELIVSKTRDRIREYRPLKRRKLTEAQMERMLKHSVIASQKLKTKNEIFIKKYASEHEICQWLASCCGMKVEKSRRGQYLLDGKNYSSGQMLIIANRKRLIAGLPPFLMVEIGENI